MRTLFDVDEGFEEKSASILSLLVSFQCEAKSFG